MAARAFRPGGTPKRCRKREIPCIFPGHQGISGGESGSQQTASSASQSVIFLILRRIDRNRRVCSDSRAAVEPENATRPAEPKNRAKFSVCDLGGSICGSPGIRAIRTASLAKLDGGSSAKVSYQTSRACSCALQSGGNSILLVIARMVRSAGWRPSAITSTILGARNASRITRRT